MQFTKTKFKCEDCIRPVTRRLGLFQAKDEYECYAESYVKCFWGLCDHHKSIDNFAVKPNKKVITTQPVSEPICPVKTSILVKEFVLTK